MCTAFAILPVCNVIVSAIVCILQLIVLPSDQWGQFTARRIRGIPEEVGHYGLWQLCSTKGKNPEKCAHPDTTYQLPTYAGAAGATSIIHLLFITAFFILAVIRVLQITRSHPDLYLGTRRLCVVKVSIAVICVVLSITISILASVGEGRFRQYDVTKGWAFWVQIIIISVDIVLLLACAFENIQYWQLRMSEPAPRDPTDEFPETFVTPDYDLPPGLRDDRIIMKDASVQSQLDGDDGSLTPEPRAIYRNNSHHDRHRRKNKAGNDVTDVHFDTRGATVITIGSHDSPPLKKSPRHTRVT